MATYYCPCCNVRKVSRENELCSSCQDPYQSVSASSTQAQNQDYEQHQAPILQTPEVDARHQASANKEEDHTQPSGGFVTITRGKRTTSSSSSPVYQPQPVYQAPPPPAAPVAPPASTSSSEVKNKKLPQADGIVKNITAFKDKTTIVEKWFKSLFMGVPFPIGDDAMEFQVFQNWNGTSNSSTGYSAEKVVVYGTITTGRPLQDNSVRVYGHRDKGNNIIASKIENSTDGTCTMFKPEPISAGFIRFITIALLGLIVLLVLGSSSLFSSFTGFQFDFSGLLTNLVCVLLGGAGTVYCFRKVKNSFGRDWMNFFGYGLGLLCAAYFTISMLGSIFH